MHTVCFKLIDYKSYNSPTCKIKNNIRTTQIIYSLCWYLGGYGIPAIPTRPSCLSSHRSHRTRRSFWRRRAFHRHIVGGYGIPAIPTQPSCLSSHGSHKTGRSFWRRRASHRCTRMSTD